jgi:hypothetical protein
LEVRTDVPGNGLCFSGPISFNNSFSAIHLACAQLWI